MHDPFTDRAQRPIIGIRWRSPRGAVILAHNYQVPEIQDVADFVGDSLGLSRQAAATDAELIVFCGVHFMAETASILAPAKTVLIPDLEAGCSLAESIVERRLIWARAVASAYSAPAGCSNTSRSIPTVTSSSPPRPECCTRCTRPPHEHASPRSRSRPTSLNAPASRSSGWSRSADEELRCLQPRGGATVSCCPPLGRLPAK